MGQVRTESSFTRVGAVERRSPSQPRPVRCTGQITLELYTEHAPKTCNNFYELAKRGYYSGQSEITITTAGDGRDGGVGSWADG